ncbi:Dynein heavy chain domain-containing protein 1 [Sciurus carolinensis]|uniref:Dynein heavy chain domain-containing protein 1 n=1 Tax=Sciurus carolinensis TaxID=30640 RepID=A0AA41MXC2_SCICA|nr:Dynein heavy chain domain-containing protein 1 [Sciurus carolinensis]
MKPHQQIWHSSSPSPPTPGKGQQQRTWNWQLAPELWARSLRQQLNVQLLLVLEEKRVGFSPDKVSSDALESWHSVCGLTSKGQHWAGQKKQRQLPKAVTESEQSTVLKLLLAELQTLFSAVLQDCSPAAWCYLHAVLGLLPPYRELLVGHLDLLPFLEQLYCWAPWVKAQLHLDLLDAIKKAFPPDSSLLDSASHVDCHPKKRRIHQRPPCSPCPFMQARQGGRQVREKLTTWLRPVTLPELQRCLGIVGTEVALEEARWLDGLSLLPLALATDIPVQYETCDADIAEKEPVGERETKSQLDYEVPVEKALQKRSTGFSPETAFLGSQVMTILKTEKFWKNIYFLYLNVAPSRYFIWKKTVRFRGLCRLRTLLGNQLLLAVPHFGAGLLHINRLLQEFHSVSWLPQEPDQCYELLDLQKALAKENYKALRLLHRFLKLCTSILKLVHEDTYCMQQNLQEYVKICNRTGQGSIYIQRVQCQKLKQKLKQAETWLLQLGKLARLINYMISQSLVSILEDEITSFVANILQAPRQNPFLRSQLVFDDRGKLSQVPCVENIIQTVTRGLQSVKASALQDSPIEEYQKYPSGCMSLSVKKQLEELTLSEFLKLEKRKYQEQNCKGNSKQKEFQGATEKVPCAMEQLATLE